MAETTAHANGGFESLGLDARLTQALANLGYEEPTPIQIQAIPPLLEGRDLVGQAATGTGKTAAFALPLLHRLASGGESRSQPSVLILVPTRELAMQVAEAVHRYGRPIGVRVLPVYGGQPFAQQLRVLERGIDVAVATPGRALDHIRRGTLLLEGIELVVLDEADEMLDMGFAEDLEAILAATPTTRQTVLFSATIPPRIASLAKRYLTDPVQIRIGREPATAGTVPRVRQVAYVVGRAHKPAALGRVLDMEDPPSALIFCRTRTEVDELSEMLNAHGYRAEAIHGGMSQEHRDRVMKKLRAGIAELLVATDVAARGLDIPQLTHVFNYDVPSAPDAYVHRIGRVGRAGREGVAITLADPREHRQLRSIEQATKQRIEVATVPTVADLRARRLELLRAALRETLLGGGLDPFRVVVESLAAEFDPMDVAVAAVKMVQDNSAVDAAPVEIPAAVPSRRPAERPTRERPTPARRWDDRTPQERPSQGARPRPPRNDGPGGRPARARGAGPGFTRVFVGAGRALGVRPQDLVGAITGEAGVSGRAIGAIDIADRFSIVEVADELASDIIAALRNTTIKGRRVVVRRDRSHER